MQKQIIIGFVIIVSIAYTASLNLSRYIKLHICNMLINIIAEK